MTKPNIFLSNFLNKLRLPVRWRRPLVIAYFCSGPIVFAIGDYMAGYNPLRLAEGIYMIFYTVWFLPLTIMRGLTKGWRGAIAPVLGFAMWITYLVYVSDPLYMAGYARFVYRNGAYVQDHCHPINFVQDGKTYAFGLCDIEIDPDGQGDFDLAYDTSGDLLNDEAARAVNHTKDRKELVNVVRKILDDDPNFIFEIANFHTTRFYRDLYEVDFEDAEDAWGFSEEYGPPPYNKKNKYRNMFYPDAKAP